MDSLATLFGFELSFLLFALFFIKLVRIDLIKFTALFAILVASKSILSYIAYPDISVLPIVITGLAGLIIILLITGVIGDKFSSDNYESILVGVGLFPWYQDTGLSVLYFFLSLIIITIATEVRIGNAFRSIGSHKMKLRDAKKSLSEKEYDEVKKKGSIIFATPIALSAIISAVIVSL